MLLGLFCLQLNNEYNSATQAYQWVEFFAGHGNCTRAVRRLGTHGARLDILFDEDSKGCKSNYMDITSHSGFWPLA